MIVRPATRDDISELARVHSDSADAAYAHVAPPEPGGLDRRIGNWTAAFNSGGSPHLAETDGAVVGVLNFGPAREVNGAGELYVLYVHPDHWGSPAGQLLIDKAHEHLAHRYDEAVLTVLADNPRARRFYERNGWVLETVRVEPHFGGLPTEVAHYRRQLVRSRETREPGSKSEPGSDQL